MITSFKKGITSEKIEPRFFYIILLYMGIFIVSTVVGHLFLPEGFLANSPTNIGGRIDFSTDLVTSTLQVFLYNCISLILIVFAGLFAQRKTEADSYFPVSISCLCVLATITGLTLGTNSFGVVIENTSLVQKLIDMLNIFKYSALWEIAGQMLIVASLATKSIVLTTGKTTIVKKINQLGFTKSDIVYVGIGLLLMLIGAFIESRAILSL